MYTVTKEFTFDMAHRLPNYDGLCNNLHGHTYKLQITLEGTPLETFDGKDPKEGMVVDFSVIKKIAKEFIDEKLDHLTMVHKDDLPLKKYLKKNSQACTIVSFMPTAEAMAKWIFENLSKEFVKASNNTYTLREVKLWETPTSFATYKD